MPYTHIPYFKRVLALGALAIAGVMPTLAHAQFEVNKIHGKKFADVQKMLGPAKEKGSMPGSSIVNYSRFNTPGAVETIVWYFWDTGQVGKAQVWVQAKPGETAADYDKVLKRYGLTMGPNPKSYQLKKPCAFLASNGAIPGSPWTRVSIGYNYVIPFQKTLTDYCKAHHLDPTNTYFWTIQVSNRRPRRNSVAAGG